MASTDAAELRLLENCAEVARAKAADWWLLHQRRWAYNRAAVTRGATSAAFLDIAGRIDGYLFDLRGGAF